MRKFVMGDLHGAYKALKQCLERAGFDYNNDELIQLGDVADGYSEVYECVEELMKIKNFISIKGNHDEWFNIFCQSGYHPDNWGQGGRGTASSYLKYAGKQDRISSSVIYGFETSLDRKDIPETHRQFFASQLLYHIDENNHCFVHSGFNRHVSFFEQPSETYFWDRDLWFEALEYERHKTKEPLRPFESFTRFNKIYIGHTSTINWKSELPMYAGNVINMDTGAGFGGLLSMMEVGTENLWQSDHVIHLYHYAGR